MSSNLGISEIHKYCNGVLYDYVTHISDLYPEIKKWILILTNNLEKEIFPALSFNNYQKMYQLNKNLKKNESDLSDVLSKIREDIHQPERDEFLQNLDPLYFRKTSEQFKKHLIEDGLIDKFNQIRKKNDIISSLWMNSVISSSGFFAMNNPIIIKDKQISIVWPILIDSYVRDFEILFKLIIRPILKLKGIKSDSYGKDMQMFFQQEGQILYEITDDAVKPYVRSRFAHQLYFSDNFNKKVIFFDVQYDSRSKSKEISFQKLNKIVYNINLLVWCIISVVMEFSSDLFKDRKQFLLSEENILLLKNHPIYTQLSTMDILKENSKKISIKLIDLMADKDENFSKSYFLIESKYIFRLFNRMEVPPFDFSFNSVQKILYLVGYSLFMERIVKPFHMAKNFIDKIEGKKEKFLLKEISEYRNGRYSKLFEMINAQKRNALAHLSYFVEKKILMYFNSEKNKSEPIAVEGILLLTKHHQIESIFDKMYDKFYLCALCAEIIHLIIYCNPKQLEISIDFLEQKIQVLVDNNVLPELLVMCKLRKSLILIEEDNLKDAKQEILSSKILLQKNRKYIMMVWAWIILQTISCEPEKTHKWLNLVIKRFTILPEKSHEKNIIKTFKNMINTLNEF